MSYVGPAIDDPELLQRLPAAIVSLLQARNGFITGRSALQVRGARMQPDWHSLRVAWEGELAVHRLYSEVRAEDIPIAEDCFGDQFLVRDGLVARLNAETGEISATNLRWADFLAAAENDPTGFLNVSYLRVFQEQGGTLDPGELLSVYPPFVSAECINPSLRPIPALELRGALADFARQIRDTPDGQVVSINPINLP